MEGSAKWKVENWQQQGKWAPKREQKWHGAKWRDENWHRPGGTLSATKNKDWSDFCISGLAQRVDSVVTDDVIPMILGSSLIVGELTLKGHPRQGLLYGVKFTSR